MMFACNDRANRMYHDIAPREGLDSFTQRLRDCVAYGAEEHRFGKDPFPFVVVIQLPGFNFPRRYYGVRRQALPAAGAALEFMTYLIEGVFQDRCRSGSTSTSSLLDTSMSGEEVSEASTPAIVNEAGIEQELLTQVADAEDDSAARVSSDTRFEEARSTRAASSLLSRAESGEDPTIATAGAQLLVEDDYECHANEGLVNPGSATASGSINPRPDGEDISPGAEL